jgi:hypothetical protein
MRTRRLLPLRRPDSCHLCDRHLQPGTEAWWDPANRTVTCLRCDAEAPADPFDGVDPALRGTAGGSAQAEHDRRAGGSKRKEQAVEAWQKGADGERRLSALLHREAGRGRLMVLDDRRIPGSSANIDHIAVAASGVYVIDAKNYAGALKRTTEGFGRRRTERLMVNARDRTTLAIAMDRQTGAVRAAIGLLDDPRSVPVIPVLCFVGTDDWGLFDPAFTIGDVHVVRPRALRTLLGRQGPLDGAARNRLARLLSARLTPATP